MQGYSACAGGASDSKTKMTIEVGTAAPGAQVVASSSKGTKSAWGSLSVSRPGFHHHIDDPAERRAVCAELFDLVRTGVLTIEITRRYQLRDAARAHRDVEARATSGSVVLEP